MLSTALDLAYQRYQSGNQNPYIEEEQTTQIPKEKGQRNKQRSKNIHIKRKIELHEPHKNRG